MIILSKFTRQLWTETKSATEMMTSHDASRHLHEHVETAPCITCQWRQRGRHGNVLTQRIWRTPQTLRHSSTVGCTIVSPGRAGVRSGQQTDAVRPVPCRPTDLQALRLLLRRLHSTLVALSLERLLSASERLFAIVRLFVRRISLLMLTESFLKTSHAQNCFR